MQDLLAIYIYRLQSDKNGIESSSISDDSYVDIDYNLKAKRQEIPFIV